jgi:hypothetical protein
MSEDVLYFGDGHSFYIFGSDCEIPGFRLLILAISV